MATYYWVGGSGTWDNSTKTNWATSSGGAGGNGPPTNADTVNFDSNSGTSAVVNVTSTAVSLSTTVNKSDITLSFSGSPTLCTTAGSFTFTAGTLTLNSSTLTVGAFLSTNSNTRTIGFGTGNITLTGNAKTIWNTDTSTGLSVSGTPVVNATYSGATGTRTLDFGNAAGPTVTEANAISLNVTAGTDIVAAYGFGFKNLNFTGFSGTLNNQARTLYGSLTISSGMTVNTGTGTITFSGTSGTQKITTNGVTLDFPLTFNGVGGTVQLQDNCTVGSTRTITLTAGTLDLNSKTLSCGIFSSSNSNTRSVAFGTGNITLTGSGAIIWSTVTSTNFSVSGTPTVNSTYSGSTGTRTINGGAVIATSEANAINFNISAGSDTVAVNNALYKNLNFTGFSGAITVSSNNIYGNLTIPATVTSFTGNLIKFAGTSGTQTVVTNNVTIASTGIQVTGGSTVVFNDALTATGTSFVFALGTIKFKAGVTTTLSAFSTSGTTQKTLQSTLTGSRATLSISSGTISVSYLTIKDIAATGGATFNAYRNLNNIDAGNNTGWDFLSTPVTTTTLAMRLGFGL